MKLFRQEQTRRSAGLALSLVFLYVAFSLLASFWTMSAGGLAVLWLGNGLVTAAVLLLPRRSGLAVLAGTFVYDFVGTIFLGHNTISESLLIAALDSFEVVCAALLARRFCGAALDMTRLSRLRALVLYAIVPATLLAGTIGSAVSFIFYHKAFAGLWLDWAGGDVLGMIVALPATLMLSRPGRRRPSVSLLERIALLTLIALSTVYCFGLAHQPLLFLLVVIVMMITFRLDAPAVAFGNVLAAVISVGFTIMGVGPIARVTPDFGDRILLLQVFLAALTLSSMASAALLSERELTLKRLGRTLAAAREARKRADEAASAKGRFLATMSHEIRTPLNGVLGMAQVMAGDLRSPLLETQRKRLDIIRQSGETLLTLLNDMLDLSKIEAGKLEIETVAFGLGETVRSACGSFMTLAQEKGLSFSVNLEGDIGRCLGDPTRLRQVIANLVSNAVKFTHDGAVTVTVSRSGDVVRFSVADTGIGVTSETRARLFQKFSQADESTTRRYGGTGLGLAICRELVEMMGSAIEVESVFGEGSRFSFQLPLPVAAELAVLEDAGAVTGGLDAATLRVLAAEDNQVNQIVLKTLLTQLGLDVVMVGNGAEAIEAWRTQSWDLILMDVQMPVMDGVTATQAIRLAEREEVRARTPIIALTANAMTHQSAEYLAIGMDAVVAKPIEATVLCGAIERVLGLISDAAAA